MEKAQGRLDVLAKIAEYERDGKWDIDVENDPESKELFPDQVDYLHKKLKTKILTHLTLKAGAKFLKSQIDSGNFVIKDIIGVENLPDKKQGCCILATALIFYLMIIDSKIIHHRQYARQQIW